MTDHILKRGNNPDIAYTFERGKENLCVLFLHGWGSHRKRPKASVISEKAKQMGCSYLSLDYTSHGESGGEPHLFTVGQGIQDTLDVINKAIPDMPLLIVGNSIGGWIGLWLAKELKQTVAFMGLAPAPDITKAVWDKMMPAYAKIAIKKGNILGPAPETEGLCLTKQLFQDGKDHYLLDSNINFTGPVHILIGDKDKRVEWERVIRLKDRLTSENVMITLIKGADHHLSEPGDLKVIQRTLENLVNEGLKCPTK